MELQDFQILMESDVVLVFDTNVFLDLYRYSINLSRLSLNVLNELNQQVWLPRQVYNEFMRHYEEEQRKAFSKYAKLERDLNGRIDSFNSTIFKDIRGFKRYAFPNLDLLEERITCIVEELKTEVANVRGSLRELEQENRQIFNDGAIEALINNLNSNGRIGPEYSYRELIEIYKEGEVRYSYDIPPGYRDKGKKTLDKFGDLIMWKQILSYSNICNNNIIFITNDEKEDWWDKDNNNQACIKTELYDEITEYMNPDEHEFYMLKFNQFLELYTTYTNRNEILALAELNSSEYIYGLTNDINNELNEVIENDIYKNLIIEQITNKYGCRIDNLNIQDFSLNIPEDFSVELDNENNKLVYNLYPEINCNILIDSNDSQYISEVKINTICVIERRIINDVVEESYSSIGIREEDTEIEEANLILDEDDMDVCIMCGERFGQYNFNDEGLICDVCSNHYECCPDCGKFIPLERSRDGYCIECSWNH